MYANIYKMKKDNPEEENYRLNNDVQNFNINDKFIYNINSNKNKYLNINQNISNNLNSLNFELFNTSLKEIDSKNKKESENKM